MFPRSYDLHVGAINNTNHPRKVGHQEDTMLVSSHPVFVRQTDKLWQSSRQRITDLRNDSSLLKDASDRCRVSPSVHWKHPIVKKCSAAQTLSIVAIGWFRSALGAMSS